MTVLGSWLAVALLARVGIPHVDPSLEPTPRPLESLGTAALCLPAASVGLFLKDWAPWLASTSPRARICVRGGWLVLVVLTTCIPACAWFAMLPGQVPRGHALAVWCLLLGMGVLSCVVLSPDLAVVLPALTIMVFTNRVTPFGANLLYNLDRTDATMSMALITVIVSIVAYVVFGSRAEGSAR
ncbi:MAG: hypothetical protein U0Q21_14095 [Dermatophilaceae bacterium]